MELIVRYSQRYISGRYLPDKAIDVLDEAGSVKKIKNNIKPAQISSLQTQIGELTEKKKDFVKNQNFEDAALTRDKINGLKHELEMLSENWEVSVANKLNVVTKKDICDVISTMTGIPLEQIDESESLRLLNMEKEMHKMVIGQNEAVRLISSAIRRSRSGVSSTKRPTGSFIFLGPTGVGKTLLAKSLAKFLFGKDNALIRIDMSDYMEKHNASRLVGAPPGYIGYEEGGSLTEQVRRNPYSVVLLDEIEKAHSDVYNLLLQILEEGELTDNLGHVINFRNTVIIMTSNAGVRKISNENRLGFSTDSSGIMQYEQIKSNAISELKKIMSPELLNRIDDVVVFEALNKTEISSILDLQIAELSSRLEEQNLFVNLSAKAREYLVSNGYEPSMGARPMRRLLQREIEDPVSELIIAGKCGNGDTLNVDYRNEKISIKAKKPSVKTVLKSELKTETVIIEHDFISDAVKSEV